MSCVNCTLAVESAQEKTKHTCAHAIILNKHNVGGNMRAACVARMPQFASSMQLWSRWVGLRCTAVVLNVPLSVWHLDGKRGAAGEAAAGVAGLLCDRRRDAGSHAEEFSPPQPPPGHPDGGEVVGQIPPDPPLCLSLWWRGRGRWRRVNEWTCEWMNAWMRWVSEGGGGKEESASSEILRLDTLGENLTIYISFLFCFLSPKCKIFNL